MSKHTYVTQFAKTLHVAEKNFFSYLYVYTRLKVITAAKK